MKYFSYISQKTGFDISCKVFLMATIGMKYLILFSGNNKKNINLLSAELAQRVVKVEMVLCCFQKCFIANSFLLNLSEHENFSAKKNENANCWHQLS